MKAYLVYMTTPDKAEAERLCHTTVSERLAACANIMPQISSLYRWEGQVQQAEEFLCILKTSVEQYPALERRLKELHSYETPCIVALPINEGLPEFLEWIAQETKIKE